MKLHLEWSPPLMLKDGSDQNLIYTCDLAKLPTAPGLYVFGRRFRKHVEALYVGKADSLRVRIKTQLKNLPLMLHVRKAKIGPRLLLIGRFVPQPGQRQSKCLPVMERALIRHFLSEGHDLVNKHGTRPRRHEIRSIRGNRVVPKKMLIDRGKGE